MYILQTLTSLHAHICFEFEVFANFILYFLFFVLNQSRNLSGYFDSVSFEIQMKAKQYF